MSKLDPRINPFRADLAGKHLQGRVAAARFVEGTRREIVDPIADLRREPSHAAALDTQALLGESVTIYETDEEGWAWGQLESDGYVGFLSANAVGPPGPAATHRVCVPRTLGFPGPDIKLPPMTALPLGARLAIVRQDERFAINGFGWHFPKAHLAPMAARQPDFVGVAESLIHAPYLWGGKTSLGIDCSGLVQLALQAAGVSCPRDSDLQQRALGKPSPLDDLKRGDLIFWNGHVAIARDAATVIHANAHHMAVAIEPLTDAIIRIQQAGNDIANVKRL